MLLFAVSLGVITVSQFIGSLYESDLPLVYVLVDWFWPYTHLELWSNGDWLEDHSPL